MVIFLSSQWVIIGTLNCFVYSKALRITSAFMIGAASSDKATAPLFINIPISEISSPFAYFETEAIGKTLARFSFFPLDMTSSTTAVLSITGSVLGMQATEVKPPLTAAFTPDAIVSLYSKPGSRRCTCISISPGAITLPLTLIISASLSFIPFPIFLIFPSSISISKISFNLFAGSITLPAERINFIGLSS